MKATLEFNLDEPDDAAIHKRMLKSDDMYFALWDIHHNLYRHVKHEESPQVALDKVFDRITEIFEEHNINIDDLG